MMAAGLPLISKLKRTSSWPNSKGREAWWSGCYSQRGNRRKIDMPGQLDRWCLWGGTGYRWPHRTSSWPKRQRQRSLMKWLLLSARKTKKNWYARRAWSLKIMRADGLSMASQNKKLTHLQRKGSMVSSQGMSRTLDCNCKNDGLVISQWTNMNELINRTSISVWS